MRDSRTEDRTSVSIDVTPKDKDRKHNITPLLISATDFDREIVRVNRDKRTCENTTHRSDSHMFKDV